MNCHYYQQQKPQFQYRQRQQLLKLKYKSSQQSNHLLRRHRHRLWSVCFLHRHHQLRLHKLFEYQLGLLPMKFLLQR
jgi:hypothetical protein